MKNSLREIRFRKCVNSSTIAEKAGISKQRYNYIERNGRIKRLEESTIRKIADVLGCSIYDLAEADQYLTVMPKDEKELHELIKKIEGAFYGREQ